MALHFRNFLFQSVGIISCSITFYLYRLYFAFESFCNNVYFKIIPIAFRINTSRLPPSSNLPITTRFYHFLTKPTFQSDARKSRIVVGHYFL